MKAISAAAQDYHEGTGNCFSRLEHHRPAHVLEAVDGPLQLSLQCARDLIHVGGPPLVGTGFVPFDATGTGADMDGPGSRKIAQRAAARSPVLFLRDRLRGRSRHAPEDHQKTIVTRTRAGYPLSTEDATW